MANIGQRRPSPISGLHGETVRRGREEPADSLEARPVDALAALGRRATPRGGEVPEVVPDLREIAGLLTGGDAMGETRFVRSGSQALTMPVDQPGLSASPTTVACGRDDSPGINGKRFAGPGR